MTIGYTFTIEEIKEIIIKHLRETEDIHIPEDESLIGVLDTDDNVIESDKVHVFYMITK
jgi:hypothetical protein